MFSISCLKTTVSIENSRFIETYTFGYGGAFLFDVSSLTSFSLQNVTFTNNYAVKGPGGMIYAYSAKGTIQGKMQSSFAICSTIPYTYSDDTYSY